MRKVPKLRSQKAVKTNKVQALVISESNVGLRKTVNSNKLPGQSSLSV